MADPHDKGAEQSFRALPQNSLNQAEEPPRPYRDAAARKIVEPIEAETAATGYSHADTGR